MESRAGIAPAFAALQAAAWADRPTGWLEASVTQKQRPNHFALTETFCRIAFPMHLIELPYNQRQLIVITEDSIADQTKGRPKASMVKVQKDGIDWTKMSEAALRDILPIPFSGIAVELVKEGVRAWAKARDSGLSVYLLGRTEAQELSFPPGHPRDGVLYVGHPAQPNVYYTMADFHRVTFEHKFSEAVDILMSLGATKLRVEHISGWDRDFAAKMALVVPDVTAKATSKKSESTSSHLLYEANLEGSGTAKLPDKLVWYPHEATWQTIASGRLNYGLKDFTMKVTYDDDFGVNAGLKASMKKTGLEIGGQFEDHKSTTWRITGKFRH